MFMFWILLSGFFDKMHLSLGIICSAIIAFFSHDLLIPSVESVNMALKKAVNFIRYIPWIIYQIVLANIDVAYRILHPKMPIDPKIITFKTKLRSDLSLTTLANSITLTPGTITVDIKDGIYYVHAVATKPADDLLSGEMENRVANVYMED